MDNAQKAIMIGVGLFITIIIIAAVMMITGMGQNLLNSGTKQLSGVSSQLESQLTAQYDNTTLTGAQVLSAVKTYYNSTELGVVVRNATTGTVYAYAGNVAFAMPTTVSTTGSNTVVTGTNTNTPLSDFSNTTSSSYIVSNGKYKAELLKTSSEAVVGIAFLRIS